jgi:hypothetical protein
MEEEALWLLMDIIIIIIIMGIGVAVVVWMEWLEVLIHHLIPIKYHPVSLHNNNNTQGILMEEEVIPIIKVRNNRIVLLLLYLVHSTLGCAVSSVSQTIYTVLPHIKVKACTEKAPWS